ncbi:MAG: transketolase [Candidatus Kerfeldbacteria bacterium]|nr:transketolase [Candidatus Kerfeldbacteria bacterium]
MTNQELALYANTIRHDIIKALGKAGSGHPGGSLGMADIFTALYFSEAHVDPKNPNDPNRDRIVLSNGHICPVLYATLARAGYFPLEEMQTLRVLGSKMQGHPHRGALPGLETTSGPLGSGLSQAAGMALGLRMDKSAARVFCLTSDGEHQEGNHWEAVMLASKYKLDRLIQIMDRNYIQIDGTTEDVMPLDPVADKYRAFGWNVIEIDGHNFTQILEAIRSASAHTGTPTLINARTIPGKGVSYMEGKFTWHGKTPNAEDTQKALADLDAVRDAIENGTYVY